MSGPPEEPAAWLRKAEADRDAAAVLQGRAELPLEIACFHYQQAAEKALKGLLVLGGLVPPKAHDLRALFASLVPPAPDIDQDALEALTPFAALARYPGFAEQPDREAVARFRAVAERCIALLRAGTSRA